MEQPRGYLITRIIFYSQYSFLFHDLELTLTHQKYKLRLSCFELSIKLSLLALILALLCIETCCQTETPF